MPTPGINGEELSKFLMAKGGALMGFFDMFSGGALSRLTIFALGIMPYISASIIMQLLTVVFPALGKLAKEGEAGRKKMTQYTSIFFPIIMALMNLGTVAIIYYGGLQVHAAHGRQGADGRGGHGVHPVADPADCRPAGLR